MVDLNLEDHGKKITCKIKGIVINDATLVFENGSFYICQNVKEGSSCDDKMGYIYSWTVEDGSVDNLLGHGINDLLFVNNLIEVW